MTESPDRGGAGQFALSSDLISELLTSMRLRGVRYRRVHVGPRFGLTFDAKPGRASFHFLAVGSAVLRTGDGTVHELSAGNAVFMPHGGQHQLLCGPDIPVRGIDSFDGVPLGDAVSDVDTCPSADRVPTRLPAALHRQPGHHWTVAELAAECNVSRSVFADRFHTTIGMPPLRYATELRMLLASQWLAQDTLPVQSVAQRLGYTSQPSFTRAFKRVTGQPPGASRDTARSKATDESAVINA